MTLHNAEEASNLLAGEQVDLFLINYDDGGEATNDLVKTLLERDDRVPTVLVSQKKDKAHLISLFSHERLRNLIARNTQVAEEELIITTEKLLRQLGIDHIPVSTAEDFTKKLHQFFQKRARRYR